ncbi:flagellar protein FliT [Cytobacillus sp. IB215665]|uniref:flagellar protein FliT n=1 Tax=Cytobacillus sp. IB215665 TaxID=3097357 RepID=UPI002A0CC11B|nr:flagellar protein FliT [Cytobacillus sp. IB215665]MDX8363829.1 flagellar protein FliT [Cytobacillus sp. IB215665]
MSVIKELYQVTKQLFELLQTDINKSDRDEQIERIQHLLTERTQFIEKLAPPYSTGEKRVGAEIVTLNKQIDAKLLAMKDEIKLDIAGLKKKKQSQKKYINPYNTRTVDGVFYDKRK